MFRLVHVTIGASLVLFYCSIVVIYRLFFSPLSKLPGPKLAAATLWYEFYYEVVQEGQFTFKIRDLHKQYGPIVRINPFEIHVNDPDGEFYHEVFSGTAVRDKYPYDTAQFGTGDTGFGATDHSLHRKRRHALNPFFSVASIDRLEPVLKSMIENLCNRIDEAKEAGTPLNMRLVYMCFTTDVITRYALNKSWNHLDTSDFSPLWCQTIKETGTMTKWNKQFPILYHIFNSLPHWLVAKLNPGMTLVLDMQRTIKSLVQDLKDGRIPETESSIDGCPRTIFQSMLNSDLPESEKSINNMWQEGQNVVGAGSDTTAIVLSVTTFHLLNNPDKLKKLREELGTAAALLPKCQGWDLATTRQLPYLKAVVLEGLRLSYGTSSRLTRIAPREDLNFQDWVIPAGTPISMSAVIQHHNETLFPDSESFIPERWIEREEGAPSLERYMVSFGKGSRQCIGINLAKAELYLTLASVFHRYQNIELFDTNFERDVKLTHDMFLPQPSKESRGMSVIFK